MTGSAADRPVHALGVAAVGELLGTDLERGLSTAAAERRLAISGPNELVAEPPVPSWRRLLAQIDDPLVLLLLVAMGISLVVWIAEGADGTPWDSLVIVVIVAANAILGVVQEVRAERAVAALRRLTLTRAAVVRDGLVQRMASDAVAEGDVLLLEEGDAVPADARVVAAEGLRVDEAALTGESGLVHKTSAAVDPATALADRTCMVHAGTAVAGGHGRAIVTATGMRTEIGRITELISTTENEPTPLQREVARLGRFLGRLVVVAAVVVVGTILLTRGDGDDTGLVDILLIGVSLAVAAVPESLPAVITVILALGVQRMALRQAIVKRLSSVETLGSASIVCTDKTGTLTRNEMTVRVVLTAAGQAVLTGVGYEPEGGLQTPTGDTLEHTALLGAVRDALDTGTIAGNAVVEPTADGWTHRGDPTEVAIAVARLKVLPEPVAPPDPERVAEAPFSSERRRLTVVVRDPHDPTLLVAHTKGAPDVVLARCDRERTPEGDRPLTAERRAEILAEIDGLAAQALRPLGVATARLGREPDDRFDAERVEQGLVWLGCLGLLDPPRAEVAAAVAGARAAGVRVVMITGDHPSTARAIAAELGIGVAAEGRDSVAGGTELGGLDERALEALAARTDVYARVAPEDKLRIVDALQANGDVVAMIGDGVNDAPALRAADIGIAMGSIGTEVAKEAADMILADDRFETVVAAMEEGRGIVSNIRKSLRYLLSSNVGEVLTMLLGVLLADVIGIADTADGLAVPLLAVQILWINLLTDTGPALALGVDPPSPGLMQRPPRRSDQRVVDAPMQADVAFIGAVMAAVTLLSLDVVLPGGLVSGGGTVVEARTVAFTTLVLAQLFNALNARSQYLSAFDRPFSNPLLWVAIAVSGGAQVLVVHTPVLQEAFGTTTLDAGRWALAIGLASVVLWAEEIKKLLHRVR